MSRHVTTIGPEDDIEQAARMMEREAIRRLPVAENGRLVGVLSHGNLVQATKNKTAEKVTEGVTRGA
jgi:CBS domain-containing protein